MTGGLHKVSLPYSDSAPDKQGVVSKTGVFNDGFGSGVGEIIAIPHDVSVEDISRMKIGSRWRFGWRKSRSRNGRGVFGNRSGIEKRDGFRRSLTFFLRKLLVGNEEQGIVFFGLTVESGLYERVVSFFGQVSQVRVGKSNSDNFTFGFFEYRLAEKSLKNRRTDGQLEFF